MRTVVTLKMTENIELITPEINNIDGLSIIIITYQRPDCLKKTVDSLISYLEFSNTEIIVCDDASKGEQEYLLADLEKQGCKVLRSIRNMGLGHNVNKGLKAAKFSFICQLQDDFVLQNPQSNNLLAIADLMHASNISYLGLTSIQGNCDTESIHIIKNLKISKFSNDNSGKKIVKFPRPYSDQPHIKTRKFVDQVGYYLENCSMIITELEYKFRVSSQNAHYIYALHYDLFKHIGENSSHNPFNKHFLNNNDFFTRISWKIKFTYQFIFKWKNR